MARRLNGNFPLAYMGVRPTTPPQVRVDSRSPTTQDIAGFTIADEWLYVVDDNPTASIKYTLCSVEQGIATWVSQGSQVETVYVADSGSAAPVNNILNVLGGTSCNTTASGNTIIVNASGGSGGISSVVTQIFDTPGSFTYTPTASMSYCIVEAIGGACGTGGNPNSGATSGAASGAYCKATFSAAQIGASKAIVVGAGGTAGGSIYPYPGGNGGNTTFGSLMIAGGAQAALNFALGGTGGIASGGSLNIDGQSGSGYSGEAGSGNFYSSGAGASTIYGIGGPAINSFMAVAYPNGKAGTGYGSGASGGLKTSPGISGTAGNGGIVIITEYVS